MPGHHTIVFEERSHLIFHRDQMYPVAGIASHPNGMRFSAFDRDGGLLLERIFFSVGGGFIVTEEERIAANPLRLRAIVKSKPCRTPSTVPWNSLKKHQPAISPSRS